MSAKILAIENYSNDAFANQRSIWIQALKRKKEREEMSVWGPVEMPLPSKSDFTMHQCYPTKMFKSEIVSVNNNLPSSEKKVIRHDTIGNYPSKIAHQKSINNIDRSDIKRKILMATDNGDEDCKHIPENCLHYSQQVPHNGINNIAPEAENVENIKISSHCHQKIDVGGSLGRNLSDNNRLFSNVKDIRERFVENINSDHLGMEAVSSKFKNSTKNIHEDANPGNSIKTLEHDASAKADVKSEFDNWCENRKREYKSSSNPTQCVSPIATVMVTEKQDISKIKPLVNKNEHEDVLLKSGDQKMFKYATSVENDTHEDDNCSTADDRVFLCKTNLSHENDEWPAEKSITDLKQILINIKSKTSKKEEIDCSKFPDAKYQKVPEIAEKTLKEEYISDNKPQFSVEVSNDKKNAVNFKKQHHSINPKIKVAEKVLIKNTKETTCADKNLEQKESSEFKNQYNKEKASNLKFNRNQTYEIPPRFRNNKNEKKNIRHEKLSVSKKVHPGNKLLNEDSKTCRKKEQKKKENSDDVPVLSESMLKDSCLSKEKSQVCIRITDETGNKNFEFMTDSVTLSRKKKTFPKLSADIPDVDSGSEELHYSADAMNIILRFVLCPSFEIVMPPVGTGVEVLAAAQTWNVTGFYYKLFKEKFLQNVLTPTNAGLVLSHANRYNLKEVIDACKAISPNNSVLSTTTPRKRQRMCLVSISTYIEPLEITIPFEPTERNISVSFKKEIWNKFMFKAISGCYSIIGFQVQLNEELILKKDQKEENKSMLKIDYSITNVNDDTKIEGTAEKPLRSINIIYFKEPLVIKPNEEGTITVETDIEPYLCSSSAHLKNKLRNKNSGGELDLIMESNRKVPNPERNVFLVGKFFYHVTKFPKNIRKQ